MGGARDRDKTDSRWGWVEAWLVGGDRVVRTGSGRFVINLGWGGWGLACRAALTLGLETRFGIGAWCGT